MTNRGLGQHTFENVRCEPCSGTGTIKGARAGIRARDRRRRKCCPDCGGYGFQSIRKRIGDGECARKSEEG